MDKGKIFIGFDCPRVDFKGSYDVKGKILILDVYGKGTCDIRLGKSSSSAKTIDIIYDRKSIPY